eukprot:TRINITY_DN32940_c0_g1_i1.p1 TRINITY_DN32940_c0_g1~~TRINITY_DN32940_c0_g1_i1.p1  ORF type:complete len:197 (+),score=28.81 TRINITY_DN32940_c0_g1_i1:289-879(+)
MQRRDVRGVRTVPERRDGMQLQLRFRNGRVSGEGSDDVGGYTVRGQYSTARRRCAFTKRYHGEDYSVKYRGEGCGVSGLGFRGVWVLDAPISHDGGDVVGGHDEGRFHVWPESVPVAAEDMVLYNTTDDDLCVVCFEGEIDVGIAPCGHLCCCSSCADKLDRCPICRQDKAGVVQCTRAAATTVSPSAGASSKKDV